MAEDKKFDQFKYQNEFNSANYDRIGLVVPKGQKAVIKDAAKASGKSVNQYVIDAIKAYMKSDD